MFSDHGCLAVWLLLWILTAHIALHWDKLLDNLPKVQWSPTNKYHRFSDQDQTKILAAFLDRKFWWCKNNKFLQKFEKKKHSQDCFKFSQGEQTSFSNNTLYIFARNFGMKHKTLLYYIKLWGKSLCFISWTRFVKHLLMTSLPFPAAWIRFLEN